MLLVQVVLVEEEMVMLLMVAELEQKDKEIVAEMVDRLYKQAEAAEVQARLVVQTILEQEEQAEMV